MGFLKKVGKKIKHAAAKFDPKNVLQMSTGDDSLTWKNAANAQAPSRKTAAYDKLATGRLQHLGLSDNSFIQKIKPSRQTSQRLKSKNRGTIPGSGFEDVNKTEPPPEVVVATPPPEMPDEETLRRARRRSIAKLRRRSGRMSTILSQGATGGDSEKLGG